MSQTTVRDTVSTAFEGKVHEAAGYIGSGIAGELIYFGKAVSRPTTTNLDQRPPTLSLYTAGQNFEGIAIADTSIERLPDPTTGELNQADYGAYIAKTALGTLRKGRIWVKSADKVDSLAKSVFVRSATATGTAATITDTTTYPVADQDGKTLTVNISGLSAQLVTFSGATTTAASVAAQMNGQLIGCSVIETGGQVKISTDATGTGVTISITAGTSDLTWAAPVAGTGSDGVMPDAAQGSFRATTATGYTDLGAIAAVKWVGAETIDGDYYGLLEINLP